MSSVIPQSEWFGTSEEGQLSVDVFRDGDELVIQSMVAGIEPKDLDLHIHEDVLTIRGMRRERHAPSSDQWFYRECHWGVFSRSLVLPYIVSMEHATAHLKNGVLEIRLPIHEQGKKLKVKWGE